MLKKICLLSIVAVVAVLLIGSKGWADDFYFVAGGGPPVGTKITSLPFPINNPGFYYLTANLTYAGTSNAITVSVDDVTIDLMGFKITGPGTGSVNYGINITGRKNVEVRNGTLSGWYFALADSGGGLRNRAFNLRVENCSNGIQFYNMSNLVKGCTVDTINTGIYNEGGLTTGNTATNSSYGISARGTIRDNWVGNCSTYGIRCVGASSIIGNTVVTYSASQKGLYIETADPNLVTQNTVSGPGPHFTAGAGTINVANTNAGF